MAAFPDGQVYGGQNKNARVVLRVHSPTKILVMGPGGMIFINSGYPRFGGMPGNVLLAFGTE